MEGLCIRIGIFDLILYLYPFTNHVGLFLNFKYLRIVDILVQFAMYVHILEIIVRNLKFSKKAEYYYLQKAPRIVEIIVPTAPPVQSIISTMRGAFWR